MNKAVERDLLSLLPSITLPLPRELVEVAASLLSQSRNKASSLKQEEEIARGYVCANIACDRLKTKLNLPTIVVRPPVAPRTYKKVYGYLDSALSVGTPRKQQQNGTPRKDPTTPSKTRLQSATTTPSRTKPTPAKTPATKPSTGKRKHDAVDQDEEAPAWTMPAIRALCKTFKIAHAAPHIYVGVASILRSIREQQETIATTPSRKRSRKAANEKAPSVVITEFENAHVPALVALVTIFTLNHLHGTPTSAEYVKLRQKCVESLAKTVPADSTQQPEDTISTIEQLLVEADNGWLEMEWFQNLPEPAEDVNGQAGGEEADEKADVDELEGANMVRTMEVPKRGFGTMMTDATDWLSDDRKADYKRWKSSVLKRIAQLEKSSGGKAAAVAA